MTPAPGPAPREALTPPPPAPPAPRQNPAAAAVLDLLAAEIREQSNSLATSGAALLDQARPFPKPLINELERRRTDAEAVKAGCTALAKRLFDVQREAKSRLETAGLSRHDALSASISFAAHANFGAQSSAAHRLEWAADAVIEEAVLLGDAIGRWGLKDGTITTKDHALEGRVSGTRFRIQNAVTERQDLIGPLKSK